MKRCCGILFAALFFGAGCTALPDGDAPVGNLVENRSFFRSEKDVSEHLATRLSLFLLEKYPASDFAFCADAGAAEIARPALAESATLAGCRAVAKSPRIFYGKTVDGGWEFSFCVRDRELWRETYQLTEKAK